MLTIAARRVDHGTPVDPAGEPGRTDPEGLKRNHPPHRLLQGSPRTCCYHGAQRVRQARTSAVHSRQRHHNRHPIGYTLFSRRGVHCQQLRARSAVNLRVWWRAIRTASAGSLGPLRCLRYLALLRRLVYKAFARSYKTVYKAPQRGSRRSRLVRGAPIRATCHSLTLIAQRSSASTKGPAQRRIRPARVGGAPTDTNGGPSKL